MAAFTSARIYPLPISVSGYKVERLQFKCNATLSSDETSKSRRFVMRGAAVSALALLNLNCELMLFPARAEETASEGGNDEGLVGALQSLFDPNEKTKSGKVLPKAYLKSAREVVKTLRESVKEDTKDMAKFRRTADAAKESIREYLGSWRGQKEVVNEESYVMLEKAIRSLAGFYSKAGPSAPLPEEPLMLWLPEEGVIREVEKEPGSSMTMMSLGSGKKHEEDEIIFISFYRDELELRDGKKKEIRGFAGL